MTTEDQISLFCSKITASGAGAKVVNTPEELRSAVSELISGADSVYCPGISALEQTILIPAEVQKPDYSQAKIAIEEVMAGVAETGTIVCSSSSGKPLQASLVTLHHIGLLLRRNIFADLDGFFEGLTDPPPTNITFITGPSRTGDIEQTLSVGVHGPARVDIIIY